MRLLDLLGGCLGCSSILRLFGELPVVRGYLKVVDGHVRRVDEGTAAAVERVLAVFFQLGGALLNAHVAGEVVGL